MTKFQASSLWPSDFQRIPHEHWVDAPVEELAQRYDTVEQHGWYANLDPTIDELIGLIQASDVIVDYSGGTGILIERLLNKVSKIDCRFIIVDASPKFLSLALKKFRNDERIAFRLLHFNREEKRLELLDELLGNYLGQSAVNIICSTNAIHLYYDLDQTLKGWFRVLKPGGHALIQSGNIANPNAPQGSVLIDDTVEKLQAHAIKCINDDSCFSAFRKDLDDEQRMRRYADLRKKYFLPIRPLEYYQKALETAGFDVICSEAKQIEAKVNEWSDFLSTYHEGVLGWAGGVEKIDGVSPDSNIINLRVRLIEKSLQELFNGRKSFNACWTYITCKRRNV